MKRRLRWTTRANKQLLEVAQRLEDARPGAGLELIDEAERLLQIAKESPRRFPRVPDDQGEVRRALVRRYGHWIIYEVHTDLILVLSIWHGARDPGSWRTGGTSD